MTRFVIDPPTLVLLVTDQVAVNPAHQLVAPNSLRSQALSLLLAAVQRGDLDEKVALQQHERMTELKIRLLGDRGSRGTAWRIAREQGWDTIADAEYLAITRLQGDALVTVDPVLAAKADGVVPMAGIDALWRGLTEGWSRTTAIRLTYVGLIPDRRRGWARFGVVADMRRAATAPAEREFTGELWYWRGPAPWYFVSVPESDCLDLHDDAEFVSYGWGMIPVQLQIGGTRWETSLWPKNGGYIVPVKAAVRQREHLEDGDQVTVRMRVATRTAAARASVPADER